MLRSSVRLVICLLLLCSFQLVVVAPSPADQKAERIQLLQEKLKKLQQLLVQVEEQKLREQPPSEPPWQPIISAGQERPAYAQYAYLLAPQMRQETLDNTLQQLYFYASRDKLVERGTLFVIPALPLIPGKVMQVDSYNRQLAGTLLQQVGMPTALEGGLLVAPAPLDREGVAEGPLLFIDLTGCDQILRSRIIEQLLANHLFSEDGSIHGFLWQLLEAVPARPFTVTLNGKRLWLECGQN